MNASKAPTIHQATRGGGGVIRGAAINKPEAIAERQAENDIVVVGGSTIDNRTLAKEIEDAVGPNLHHDPHTRSAGPRALPHYQQDPPPPKGHSFYETTRLRAWKS